MWAFPSGCDEFNVSSRLYFKLDLAPSREAVLHFFEQVRKAFPRMHHLRRREDSGVLLEEHSDDDGAERRTVRLDPNALKLNYENTPSREAYAKFANVVLGQAPYDLSLSDLDFDYLDVVFTFDLEFRGNHDELVADALFNEHPFASVLAVAKAKPIDCQPFFGVALNDDCSEQAYLEIKSRTSTFEVRTSEFEPALLSVYLTVRRYWDVGSPGELQAVHKRLLATAEALAAERVVPQIVQRLATAIASRG